MSLDAFTRAYIEAALWTSYADGDEPLDKNYNASELSDQAQERIEADCKAFYDAHSNLFMDDNHCEYSSEFDIDELAGHDFWLTRNGHGAGFWDGNWEDPAATILDKASKSFGACDLYVGDDDLIYIA